MPSLVLVTGADGFIGKTLLETLTEEGFEVRGIARSVSEVTQIAPSVWFYPVDSINSQTDWSGLLSGVEFVVHLAARVHRLGPHSGLSPCQYLEINARGTERLAREAAKQGVKRFVYLSSLKVLGEHSERPFTESDPPCPAGPYAFSKLQAERFLNQLNAERDLEVVILRPPLVYGPGVAANFSKLMNLVQSGIPLPFAGINNRRSLLYVRNLTHAIVQSLKCPEASGRTFLLSDGLDLSIEQLCFFIAAAMGRSARLWPCPSAILRLIATVTGNADALGKLVGSLQVDSSLIREVIGWVPPYQVGSGIRETVQCFMSNKKNA